MKGKLQKVCEKDRYLLFEWVNDEQCRKNSFHSEPVSYEEHCRWFSKKLADQMCHMYIYCYEGIPVGQVRIDCEAENGCISYFISCEYRGQGHARNMLQLVEYEMQGKVRGLTACVKYGNIASQMVFKKKNYTEIKDKDYIKYYKRISRKAEKLMYIPYGRQSIDEEDIQAIIDVLHSDYLTTGPKVAEFERKVADYVGAKYAVAVSNGTAALHIACLAAGISKGDEVITTPVTFAASSNCVLYCGGIPVFADIDADTYNIRPQEIEQKITGKTKAIIPVHYTGQPCDMEAITAIARKHNLLVIEDAAHALGASYKGKRIGSISDMTCFSFHPVKPITTGEGGMVVTDNEGLYKKLILFRSHGITRDGELMTENQGDWYYQQLELGYNYRITDISCALGCSQMDKLDSFLEKRKEIAYRYDKAFKDVEGIKIPQQMENCSSGWHLYMIQVLNKKRKEVFEYLRAAGIGVNVHYIPVYQHPYYRNHGYSGCCLPNAESFYERAISLPVYPALTAEQQQYIINKVIEVVVE